MSLSLLHHVWIMQEIWKIIIFYLIFSYFKNKKKILFFFLILHCYKKYFQLTLWIYIERNLFINHSYRNLWMLNKTKIIKTFTHPNIHFFLFLLLNTDWKRVRERERESSFFIHWLFNYSIFLYIIEIWINHILFLLY